MTALPEVENVPVPPRRAKTGGRKAGTPNRSTSARLSEGGAAPASTYLPLQKAAAPFPLYRLARTDSLTAYARNARTHSPEQVNLLARLIAEYGFTNPVLTDGKRGVVAGHGRILAAKQLGMDVVPTIELSHLSPAQRRAYVIADNASALRAGWNDELLRFELGELRDEGFDLSLTGLDGAELDSVFGADEPAGTEEPPGDLDGKVCCPSCGHEFQTVAKAFRIIAGKTTYRVPASA